MSRSFSDIRSIDPERASNYLPEHLRRRAHEFRSNPNLMDLTDSVAVTEARLSELYDRLESGLGGPESLKMVEQALMEVRDCLQNDNIFRAGVVVDQAIGIIGSSITEFSLWDEIRKTMSMQKTLTGVETRRRAMQWNMMTAEQALVLMSRIIDILTSHIDDPELIEIIGTELRELSS